MLYYSDNANQIHHGDAMACLDDLPPASVHCAVTSPPYWKLRDYGVDGQLGLENTIEDYLVGQVAVFSKLHRVLRDDGTLWLNIGDSYAGSGRGGYVGGQTGLQGSTTNQDQSRLAKSAGFHQSAVENGATGRHWVPPPEGYKPKDMLGIPWLLAFAMRQAGWYLRSEIIWHKRSPMPESIRDRPCKSHEHIFLFSKSPRYFYDLIGSQEECTGNAHSRGHGVNLKAKANGQIYCRQNESFSSSVKDVAETRNMRSVWPMASYPLKEAHFAAFPPELVRRCLSAGVSPFGCCSECGKPYERTTAKERIPTRPGDKSSHCPIEHNSEANHPKTKHDLSAEANGFRPTAFGNRDPQRHITRVTTTGCKPACDCLNSLPVPCTVLDPFHGAGTTMKVCQRLNLNYVGIELNSEYIDLSLQRPDVKFPHEKRKSVREQISHLCAVASPATLQDVIKLLRIDQSDEAAGQRKRTKVVCREGFIQQGLFG